MSGGDEEKSKTWGSWEELLLACAVKRHGLKNWESVSMELQTKTSLPQLLTTAHCCKQKYQDLKRRFQDDALADNNHYHIPWLEQLRKVRVDELKREVQRYDLSILSLQHKVKTLEEEREKSDLEKEKTGLPNDKTYEPERSSELSKRLVVSGEEESDRENRSVNESNSTGLSAKNGGELQVKIDLESEPAGGGKGPAFNGSKVVEEDSVTQLSGDVQSSASFGTRRKTGSGGDKIIPENGDAQSEPLIRLLDFIRSHNHASLFERRLKSQESNKYKEVVRQHVDLQTIQTRVEGGSYYSSRTLKFYRDLLLLFNNVIVYFPKSSLESQTALYLRNLVSNEMKKDSSQEQPPPPPPPQSIPSSDSLLAKQQATAPIIVCRKRSSVSAKPSSTIAPKGDNQKQQCDDTATEMKPQPLEGRLIKLKTEEKPMLTGARSSRRSSRNLTINTPTAPAPSSGNKKQNAAAQGSKQETPITDNKKKSETLDKKKSVVDFLKRIKNNSPVKKSKGGEEQKMNNNSSGKKDKVKERILLTSAENRKQEEETSPSKKGVGRPSKKTPEVSMVSGKRGRESGGKEVASAKSQSKRAKR